MRGGGEGRGGEERPRGGEGKRGVERRRDGEGRRGGEDNLVGRYPPCTLTCLAFNCMFIIELSHNHGQVTRRIL